MVKLRAFVSFLCKNKNRSCKVVSSLRSCLHLHFFCFFHLMFVWQVQCLNCLMAVTCIVFGLWPDTSPSTHFLLEVILWMWISKHKSSQAQDNIHSPQFFYQNIPTASWNYLSFLRDLTKAVRCSKYGYFAFVWKPNKFSL